MVKGKNRCHSKIVPYAGRAVLRDGTSRAEDVELVDVWVRFGYYENNAHNLKHN